MDRAREFGLRPRIRPGQQWREQGDDFFRSGGARPQYAMETRSSLMACQLVRDGAGIAILDRMCAQAIDTRGIVLRPLSPERWISFGYIHQLQRPPGAAAFVDCVRRVVRAFRERSEENARAVVPGWDGADLREAEVVKVPKVR